MNEIKVAVIVVGSLVLLVLLMAIGLEIADRCGWFDK